MRVGELVQALFRQEHGKLVATLSRRYGVENLELIEDVVQSAFTKALEVWEADKVPSNPSGWLFQVAHHGLIDVWRTHATHARLIHTHVEPELSLMPDTSFSHEIDDTLLRMIFVCCDERIPACSRHVLALKVLCGLSVAHIAHRLFLTPASVYKQLSRARARLRCAPLVLDDLTTQDFAARLPGVLQVLYTLFTEGYLSSHPEQALRRDLCDVAIELTTHLAHHPICATPHTHALLGLMHLHVARMSARQDPSGVLLLLEEQDRTQWDQGAIATGLNWLARAAHGDAYSRYHAEACIAAEHCLASSLMTTRWDRIVVEYKRLELATHNPMYRLSGAVATAQLEGPEAGLALLEGFDPPSWFTTSYLWFAVRADLHRLCGDMARAARYYDLALEIAPHESLRAFLKRRQHQHVLST